MNEKRDVIILNVLILLAAEGMASVLTAPFIFNANEAIVIQFIASVIMIPVFILLELYFNNSREQFENIFYLIVFKTSKKIMRKVIYTTIR
ncbi:MAG: hypothetical protein PF439_00825 [Helicobacteraceae bacterium]|nr:hypothetical protein [Helicobacteraceae bacterium]